MALVTAEPVLQTTQLPTAKDVKVSNEAYFSEVLETNGGQTTLVSALTWVTQGNIEFPTYSWIQSYAEFEDPENPGVYSSVTCNVGFNPSDSYAETVRVGNFLGDSIAVGEVGGKWDSYGTPAPAEWEPYQWKAIPEGDDVYKDSYTTVSEGGASVQACTVWAPMWSQTNGEPDDFALNAYYW